MENIPILPPPGIITELDSFSDTIAWIDGNNMRPWNGQMQTIGGWTQRGSLFVSGTPKSILEWKSSAGTSYIAYGTTTKLYVETGGVLYDITPTGTFTTAVWSLDTYGDTLIACESGGKIYQWSNNTATPAAQVTNAPTNVTCILVARRQLLALGCNEEGSGTFNARCVRGSDIEDITSWTTASTNNVFEHVIDGAAPIVTAKEVSGLVAIWTEAQLYYGSFLGNPGQTYQFDQAGKQCGCIGLRGAVIANGTAYWLTKDLLFKAWVPGSEPITLKCSLQAYFRANIQTSNKTDTFAAHVSQFDEIWFTYPNSSTYRGRYIAFNISTGLWFKGAAERRAMHQGLSGVIAALSNGNLVTCESGQAGGGSSAVFNTWSITSNYYYLNDAKQRLMLLRVWPNFGTTDTVTLTLNAAELPRGAVTGTAALTLTSSDTKKDFRLSGRLVSIKIEGADGTYARIGKTEFGAVTLGQR